MPIAHVACADPDVRLDPGAVVGRWSELAGVDAEHMTVNVTAARQGGTEYRLMADLRLPSLWSPPQVEELQLALATALAECAELKPAEVHVLTSIVQTGHVVEGGEIRRW